MNHRCAPSSGGSLERSSFRVRWKPDSGGSIICAIEPHEALTASIAPNRRPPKRTTSGGEVLLTKSITFASFDEACKEFNIIRNRSTSHNNKELASPFPCFRMHAQFSWDFMNHHFVQSQLYRAPNYSLLTFGLNCIEISPYTHLNVVSHIIKLHKMIVELNCPVQTRCKNNITNIGSK